MNPSDEQLCTSDRAANGRRAALCCPEESLSAERLRNIPPYQMGPDGVLPRRLLPAAVRALEPRSGCARSGGAGGSAQQPLLFLFHRAVAPGGLLLHRASDRRRYYAVSDEFGGRSYLVRLSLPANRLDRSVLRCRASGGR